MLRLEGDDAAVARDVRGGLIDVFVVRVGDTVASGGRNMVHPDLQIALHQLDASALIVDVRDEDNLLAVARDLGVEATSAARLLVAALARKPIGEAALGDRRFRARALAASGTPDNGGNSRRHADTGRDAEQPIVKEHVVLRDCQARVVWSKRCRLLKVGPDREQKRGNHAGSAGLCRPVSGFHAQVGRAANSRVGDEAASAIHARVVGADANCVHAWKNAHSGKERTR